MDGFPPLMKNILTPSELLDKYTLAREKFKSLFKKMNKKNRGKNESGFRRNRAARPNRA